MTEPTTLPPLTKGVRRNGTTDQRVRYMGATKKCSLRLPVPTWADLDAAAKRLRDAGDTNASRVTVIAHPLVAAAIAKIP